VNTGASALLFGEDMEDLKITTLSELIQRIEELHRKLDNEH
jgi:hypothetical protein